MRMRQATFIDCMWGMNVSQMQCCCGEEKGKGQVCNKERTRYGRMMMNDVCKLGTTTTTNTASELFMAGKCQKWMRAGRVWEDCMLRRDKWERSPYVGREVVAETRLREGRREGGGEERHRNGLKGSPRPRW